MNYEKLAQEIVQKVGGKDNVNSVIHCVTRLRFKLKNESLADVEGIKNLSDVMTVVISGGQFQVVIGDEVGKVFAEVIKQTGNANNEAADDSTKDKGSLFHRFITIISGIFMPILGVMAASGILKGFLTAAVVLGWMTEDMGGYQVLFVTADAMFYFLPIILGFSAGKTFNTNSYLTATIGAALVYPTMVELYNAGGSLTFFQIPVVLMSYVQSVIPIIIAAFFTAKLEKLLLRIIPKVLQLIFVPATLLVVVVPMSFLMIGPVSVYASSLLADGAMWLYSLSPAVTGFFLAGVWQLAVMFGLHWGFIPIFINNITTIGYDSINALLYCTVFAQTGAALAVAIKAKQAKLKTISTSATVSGFLGITEPAIYGVNIPLKRPFIMASIGAAFGGATAGFFNAKMYGGFASGGVFGIPMFISPEGLSWEFYGFVLSLAIAFSLAVLLTYFLGYKSDLPMEQKEEVNKTQVDKVDERLNSPLKGELVKLKEVPDEVFSSGMMGQGFAIIPEDGKVYAPFDGTVMNVFETKHAIGFISSKGAEVLIHIGLDTVHLKGECFNIFVSEKQAVKKGDLIGEFDLEGIIEKGYNPITPVVITNANEFTDISIKHTKKMVSKDDVVSEVK
ncbi:PTS system, beta-glucosides-specific IIC component [Evansella caseinilytica]|uniref:PTS system, beta-glucosides-specific IIC component n=1 Tax=Evansella caseinilytica TaxID=1503961 RepID=A0A1H3SN08_9BACI|nr:beta-glucoside-specific PTS transporter subunit IIABC [Evansella caseinilytica]SDZ38509.1 PTS system, beta-glucosides-specific IIC component [Evansella caseinilytica]